MCKDVALATAVSALSKFLGKAPLTTQIEGLERALNGATRADIPGSTRSAGITTELLKAAVVARENLGRISDLIHACGMSLALPYILEPSERITKRPSLASGNDRSRPYDLETDRRVAEFKFSVWTGQDAMRKRQTFKDFVHLTLDDSGRRRSLYVLGPKPLKFLRGTRSTAAWGLDRAPAELVAFEQRYGDPTEFSISAFVMGPGCQTEIIDLAALAPEFASWSRYSP
jgi:hypothetical protein